MRSFICICLLAGISYLGNAQTNFHRIFSSLESGDTTVTHMASTFSLTGGIISILGREVNGNVKTLVFIKQDNKGNMRALKEYDFGQDTIDGILDVDVRHNIMDSVYFAFTAVINGKKNSFIGRTTPRIFEGMHIRQVEGIDFDNSSVFWDITGNNLVTNFIDSTSIHCLSDSSVVVSKILSTITPTWSHRYELRDTNNLAYNSQARGVKVTRDSAIHIGGILDDDKIFQMIIDSLDNGIRANSMELEVDIETDIIAADFSITPNGQMVHVGSLNNADKSSGYIVFSDENGTNQWARSIIIQNVNTTIVGTECDDISVNIVGTFQESESSMELFSAKFDLNGELQWISSFNDRVIPNDSSKVSIDITPTRDIIIGSNGLDKMGMDAIIYIRQSQEGTTLCSDTISEFVLTNLELVADTLEITKKEGIVYREDTLAYDIENYSNLLRPQLIINPRAKEYCPNEEINELLEAEVTIANPQFVSYLWSTGDATDTTRVFMDGDYIVEATITENECYTMCDTVMLTRSNLPVPIIQPNVSRYCLEKIVILTADVIEGGKPPFEFNWSTGETTQSIEISEQGIEQGYSVEVFDGCGDSVEVSLFLETPNNFVSFQLESDISQSCETGTVIITAINLFSNLAGALEENFSLLWSTGETTTSIEVSEDGRYSLQVTDICGETSSREIEIVIPRLLDGSVTASYEANCGIDGQGNEYIYTLSLQQPIAGLSWVNLRTGGTLGVSQEQINSGTVILNDPTADSVSYIVDLVCDQEQGEVMDLSNACRNIVIGNIFFPNGNATTSIDSLDITFGPTFRDGTNGITNYELKVFNRFGQEVFATNDIEEAWDGRFKDDLVPTEVYIWYIKFDDDANEEPTVLKGNVTVVY